MRKLKLWLGVLLLLASSLLTNCGFGGGPAPRPTLGPTPAPEALAQGRACPNASGPIEDAIVLNSSFDLVSVAAAGHRTTALTALPMGMGLRTFAPVWSPDGETLAFTFFFMSPDPVLGSWLQLGIICGIDRQTGQGRILARGASDSESLEEATWTPDGRALVVTYMRYILNEQREFVSTEISVVRYDLGSGTLTPLVRGASRPALSPDGQRLAYVQLLDDGYGRALMVAQADGQQPRPLLTEQSELRNVDRPRWSPDGRRLLFTASLPPQAAQPAEPASTWLDQLLGVSVARAHGDPAHLWLTGLEAQSAEKLTAQPLDDPIGAWSADGQQIVYVTTLGPVMLLDLNSRQERPLSDQGLAGFIDWNWR